MIRSTLITLVVSSVFGLGFLLAGKNFFIAFSFALLGQFVIFFLINYFTDVYVKIKGEQIINDRIAEFSKQGAEVQCSFCGEPAFVPIDLSIDNFYVCEKCTKENSVIVDIKTAQTTTPMKVSDQDLLNKVENDESGNTTETSL